jgi:heterodisulfide reductase subunit D
MTQLDRPGPSDPLSVPFTPGMRGNPDELAAIPDEIAHARELPIEPTPTQEFTETWRNAAYNCFSSGHKFCREVCPVMQVTRNESWTPTAFHANVVAMDKGEMTIEEIASDYVNCTQCGACELRCPNTLFTGDFYRHRTRTVDVVKAMRALMVATGNEREGWKAWNERLAERHNEPVLGELDGGIPVSQEHVADWADGLDIPVGGETILFVDCEAAFYRTSYTRAFAQLLQKAGVGFGLMREQWCCGGPAAEMGYLDLARKHAEHNVADWRAVGAKRIIAPDPHDFIAFTEDYPKYFGEDYEFEIVLGVELVNDLVKEGRIALTERVERTVTYHDPCRLNKRKGVHRAPRELLRAVPGITFEDVDHVTQWSYCSGGGGGLPIEKPEIAAEISRRRVARAKGLEVDTLVSACPWSERPLSTAAEEAGDLEVLDLFELVARSAGIEVGGHAKPPATEVRP